MFKLMLGLFVWVVALLFLCAAMTGKGHAGVLLPEMGYGVDWWVEAVMASVALVIALLIIDWLWRWAALGLLLVMKYTLLPVALVVAWVTKFLCWALCAVVTRIEIGIVAVRAKKEAVSDGI